MSSQVLVTGAAGFIGSHVCRHLLQQGHQVIGLDDLSGGFRDYVPDRVKFVEGSVTDAVLVRQLFEKNKFECVFHLAAYAAEGLSHFIKHFNYTNRSSFNSFMMVQSLTAACALDRQNSPF
jgi:UDP-glucose 4-epimerase